ncbi:hypothetical protein H2200_006291 [Cladophialophora chaetospira]|uniref:NACHT-NTPase and P-loop NTPases N-terminal domain-containing protein n=1 Tax=Cladophialophora chaetospira TaxID=386627 RepID=A0AA39CIX9_9EURO|nr:hypothetical protein H2200_006291 [Cladophialophora chaetospira]
MSGIEAVLGAVASGAGIISLSIQLAESALKLKRIYDAAKDAPRAISDIIDDLDTMAVALQQLEEHRQPSYSSEALLARCIDRCKKCAAVIQRLVDKMEDSMKRHPKSGRLYSAFKQRDVKELLDSLERAKTSLQIAHTIYHAEEQRQRDRQHADALALYAEIMTGYAGRSQLALLHQHSSWPQHSNHQTIPGSENTSTIHRTHVRVKDGSSENAQLDVAARPVSAVKMNGRRGNTKTCFRANVRLPAWLSNQIFGFALTQAQWGWTLHLHTYNCIPANSPIFNYCRKGNLAGVRRLIESGRASPLDVYGSNWTLLDDAASHGHLNICQYLLSNWTWPDRAALMDHALDKYISQYYNCYDKKPAQMYRLFLTDPEFDPSIDHGKSWVRWCPNAESLGVILQNESLDFHAQPLALRFKMAISLTNIDAQGFLKCIGLHASDERLASLSGADGGTVLPHIALQLRSQTFSGQLSIESQQWIALGVDVLRDGANPSIVATIYQEQLSWRSTPLMVYLTLKPRRWAPVQELDFCTDVVYRLHIWAEMLQNAGLDLLAYGAAECEIWASIRAQECWKPETEEGVEVVQLVYGPTPAEWSLEISVRWNLDVYTLRPPPGAFNDDIRVPAEIIWMPTNQETDEGPWTRSRRQTRVGPKVLIASTPRPVEPFVELVNGTQDDSGVVMLMQHRASRAPRESPRSYSQPPCLRRTEMAYYAKQSTPRHEWLTEYHLCPFDSSWRFGCVGGHHPARPLEQFQLYQMFSDNVNREVFHVRSCVKGIVSSGFAIQEFYAWRNYSFLAEIASCQDNRNYFGTRIRMGRMRHTGGPSCPQGCRNVLLNKLKVPEALRPRHSTPYYRGPEDDDDDNAGDCWH